MHVWDDKFGHQTFRYKKYAYVKNRTGTYTSLYGDKLKRVSDWDPEQPELFESDVNPEIRVLVDNYTDEELVSVLAHEVGHYKKNHILTSMFFRGKTINF